MISLGIHIDNWRTLSGSFRAGCESAEKYGLEHIETGIRLRISQIDGSYPMMGVG